MARLIFMVFMSALFFKEALCLTRKLIGHQPNVHSGTKFGIGGVLPLESICAKTDYAPLCINSLQAKVHGPIDPLVTLKAEIEATQGRVQIALSHLAQLQLQLQPDVSKDSLRICKQQYEFAIDSLVKAKFAIDKSDFGSLTSELSAVTTFASTCDDTFTEVISPLADDDEEVSHLGSNCLAITDLVKW